MKEYAKRTSKTYRQELAGGEKVFSDSPLDAPRPAMGATPEKVCVDTPEKRDEKRVHTLSDNPEKACVDTHQKACAHAFPDRVHTLSQASGAGGEHTLSEQPEPRTEGGVSGLYEIWVAAIRAGKCKPTVRSSRPWIQKRIAPIMTGGKTNDLKRVDSMCRGFFKRAIHEGLMCLNPDFKSGGKKYLWVG